MHSFELNAASLLGKTVIFRLPPFRRTQESDPVLDGTVLMANDDRQEATVCYLYGLKSYTDDIPYDCLVAVHNPAAECVAIEQYKGSFIDLRQEVRA